MSERPARRQWTRVCAVTPGERIGRAVAAVFMIALAVSLGDNLWIAAPAGVFATFLTIGAITGWCPTALIPRREQPVEQNDLGIPEARQRIDV